MPTAAALRQALGRRPGFRMKLGTTGVQASPPSGSYVGTATGSSATRRIVSTDLTRLSRSGTGGDDVRSDFWENGYGYIPSLPLQAPLAANGYTPYALASSVTDQVSSSVPVGYATLARSFATALAPGLAFELHSPLPPVSDDDGLTSMLSFINRACDTMVRPRRVMLNATTNQTRYDLASYGVTRREQVGAVYAPLTDSNLEPYPIQEGDWAAREDGEKLLLLLFGAPFGSGQTFSVDLSLPLSAWVRLQGSSWGTSTVGLVNETDEVAGDASEIALAAAYLAYDELANDTVMAEVAPWAKLRDRFALAAKPLMQYAPQATAPERAGGNGIGDSYSFVRQRGYGYGIGGGGGSKGWP